MAELIYYIYVLFRENGIPFYVGKGKDGRWLRHNYAYSTDGNRHKRAIILKMRAAGHDIPKIKLHEDLSEDAAIAYEKVLIAAIGRADKGRGPLVNLTDGGEGASGIVGIKRSPETRAKMSAAQRGKRVSTETRARLSEINRGKKRSPEVRRKIAEASRGRKHSPESIEKMRARKVSAEAIARTASANRGRKNSPETIEKMRQVMRSRVDTPETKERRAAAQRGKKQSQETINKRFSWRQCQEPSQPSSTTSTT